MNKEPVVQYGFTPEVPALLQERELALLVSTYQAQRVLLMHPTSNTRMNMLMRVMPKPTGVAYNQGKLAICCKSQVWIFTRVGNLGGAKEFAGCDWVYSPRLSFVTGDVAAHQIGWVNGEIVFINTRFSCICRLHQDFSFEPVWKPEFISAIVPEDRCHLNGFCLDENGKLKYATALGMTDNEDGWRAGKANGGVLIDIESNKVVFSGLCMPHTPFLYKGQLYVLESGNGTLVKLDISTGTKVEVARFPGFLRGFSVHNDICFVGLSQIRNSSTFSDLPIGEMHKELECAVYLFDLRSNQIVGMIKYTKGIEELFDICLIENVKNPHLVGFEEETIDQIVVLP